MSNLTDSSMAKYITISNEAYERLKEIKEKENKSFSDVLMKLIAEKRRK